MNCALQSSSYRKTSWRWLFEKVMMMVTCLIEMGWIVKVKKKMVGWA